jgi:nucleotidyltransferase substrate binding protein (TIGR01987 family)
MTAKDIRWIQRFNNFKKAFGQLSGAVELAAQRDLTDLEKQGLIQAFEFTHELAWNTLKDFLENRGAGNMYGSKDVTRAAFKSALIENGETWMQMIESRNLSTHTYDEATAEKIISAVIHLYFIEFKGLQARLETLKKGEE